jgi:universal stress protein A
VNSYKQILLSTDFSKPSEHAAARAVNLAKYYDAQLTVIHVVDYVPPGYAAAELPRSLASEELLVERARDHLKKWIEDNGLGDCQQVVKAGSPKSEIVSVARDSAVDLIVMGTHGEKGLARLLGSTTQAVMHDADCDVLAVRAKS